MIATRYIYFFHLPEYTSESLYYRQFEIYFCHLIILVIRFEDKSKGRIWKPDDRRQCLCFGEGVIDRDQYMSTGFDYDYFGRLNQLHWLLLALSVIFLPDIAGYTRESSGNGKSESPKWEFSGMAYYYLIPDQTDQLIPILYAGRERWYLEVRYNYEDSRTASLFAGRTLRWGDRVSLEATPMAGVAFGNTRGFVPGLEMTLAYRKIQFYNESEYVISFQNRESDFLYLWSELEIAPWEMLSLGVVAQCTKEYQTDFESQQGILLGVHYKDFEWYLYGLNLFESNRFIILALTAYF